MKAKDVPTPARWKPTTCWAGVTPAPAADVRRAGGGKADSAGKRARRRYARLSSARWAKRAASQAGARKAVLERTPRELQPTRSAESPPTGDGWLHEIKWDGYRLLAMRKVPQVRIIRATSRPGAERVPELREALAA